MKLFDSHCHLDDKTYKKDLHEVLQRAQKAGVIRMMTIGTDKKTSIQAVLLAQSHDGIYASVGIHPHEVKNCGETTLKVLVNLAKNEKVRAWGEIGLDFNRMYSPRKDQEKWFEKQIEIAADIDLPMIFHERDSNGRFLDILTSSLPDQIIGVVHCFSGNENELKRYLDLGLYIGITGIITIKQRGIRLRQLAPKIPQDRLLIETDAPYLVPAPEKNYHRRNEPAFVKSVLLKLAKVRNEDPAILAHNIWQNTCRLYGLET